MTRAPRRRDRRGVLGVLAVLTMVVLAPLCLQETSAAWTQSVHVAVPASSGTWSVAPGTCVVEKLAGYTGVWNDPTCTVTSLTTRGEVWGTAGSRTANAYASVSFSDPGPGGQQSNVRVVLTLDLAGATNLPTDWAWANAGVVGGNLDRYPGYACATLARTGAPLTAYAPSWVWSSPSLYFQIVENRSGASGLICS